jgi:hypothetical protein
MAYRTAWTQTTANDREQTGTVFYRFAGQSTFNVGQGAFVHVACTYNPV